jgi:hypothetical protein
MPKQYQSREPLTVTQVRAIKSADLMRSVHLRSKTVDRIFAPIAESGLGLVINDGKDLIPWANITHVEYE